MQTTKRKVVRHAFTPPTLDEHPLLRVLIAEATRRGDTLKGMAKRLGVSYERVAQWRRGEASIARANRKVHEAAAIYLRVPTAFVLCMAGIVGLRDFLQPSTEPMGTRVALEIDRMRCDPYIAGFVPDALANADQAVRAFVVLLWHEVSAGRSSGQVTFEWIRTLELAAMGHAQALAELPSVDATRRSSKTS